MRWLEAGIGAAISSCFFYHEDFKVTKHDRLRLATAIDRAHKMGKLTKDRAREALWVGASLVQRLAYALVNRALKDGTRSWDLTISKTLSFVLQAAVASRSGDIIKSKGYTNEYCLKWKDVTIKKPKGGFKFEHLVAVLELRFEKDKK